MSDNIELINTYLQTNRSEFRRRVKNQSESLVNSDHEFSPNEHGIGVEREYYLVGNDLRLEKRSDNLCERSNSQHELGLHNVEFASRPCSDFSEIESFINELQERYEKLQECTTNQIVVRDGGVAVSPEDQTMAEYFSDCYHVDGYKIPKNMTDDAYYCLLNHDLSQDEEKSLSHPLVSYERNGLMPVSLTASIQPHIQVPNLDVLPNYFSACIRVCAPILSISTNSPYLPADMYDEKPSTDPFSHENRITMQRDLFNNRGRNGMRLPKDVESFEDLIDRIAGHDLYMPLLSEDAPDVDWAEDMYEFNHQQRTTWWWVNPRVGDCAGGSSDKAVRIELRPFSNQPTFKDNISVFLLSVGAVTGIVETQHPVLNMDWDSAYENFTEAEKKGSDADMTWVTKNGRTEGRTDLILEDLIEVARIGLNEMGVNDSVIDKYLRPVSERDKSPSKWKSERYDMYLSENNYKSALRETFKDYIRRSQSEEPFCDWEE